VDHALVGPAVAEEGDHDLVGLSQAGGQGGPRADGQAGRHDAVAAQDVEVQCRDVHGAAQPPAVAGGPPHELGHHAVHPGPLGQAVTVPAVVAHDVVVGPQAGADAGRHRLLTDVRVGGALHEPGVEQLGRLLVEAADADHGLVEALEGVGREVHRRHPLAAGGPDR
jgi:hypothetical protein